MEKFQPTIGEGKNNLTFTLVTPPSVQCQERPSWPMISPVGESDML